MGTHNSVTLIGNIGGNSVELRHTGDMTSVVNLRLATDERWRDRGGQIQQRTEWHRVTVWGALAETCAKHLKVGDTICVIGRLKTTKQTKNFGGVDVNIHTTDVVAEKVIFLKVQGGNPETETEGTDDANPNKDQERV